MWWNTFFKKIKFSITSVGFSNKIVERNKAKLNDDIYVTGNLGDSFVGLKVLQKKFKLNNSLMNYFKINIFNQFYRSILQKNYFHLQIHLLIYLMD